MWQSVCDTHRFVGCGHKLERVAGFHEHGCEAKWGGSLHCGDGREACLVWGEIEMSVFTYMQQGAKSLGFLT